MARFLELFRPDILFLQELRPPTRAYIDARLPRHQRVEDPFGGWANEGNIYWNAALLEHEAHGAEEVGHLEPEKRFFWARLKLLETGRTLFASTAHLTPPNEKPECDTGFSPRVGQLNRIVAGLKRHAHRDEPAFFAGDMNDARHPQRILHEAGFVTCFAALGLASPPTFKSYPTAALEPGGRTVTEAIDLIAANGHCRPMAAMVPHVYCGDVALSDHWPVHAVYELQASSDATG